MARYSGSFLCAIVLLFPVKSSAQTVYFEKLINETEILYSVAQTVDKGYILSGLTGEDKESFVKLIKTDAYGDTIWTQKYPGIGRMDYYRTSAIQTSDGGYMLSGTIEESENRDIFLIKTDPRGGTVWQKTYGDSLEEKSWSVQQTKDSGYLISAFRDPNYFCLVKTDSGGTVEWEREFELIYTIIENKCQAIQTNDQGYVVITQSNLFKFSQDGDSLWIKSFDNWFNLVQETTDGDLILAGRSGSGRPAYAAGYRSFYLYPG